MGTTSSETVTSDFIDNGPCSDISQVSARNLGPNLPHGRISALHIEERLKVNLPGDSNLPSIVDKRLSNICITVPLGSTAKYSMSDICRLCATVVDSITAVNIFSTDQFQENIACKINKYLPIVVYESDPFPKTVCNPCVTKLNQFHELVEKCVAVEEQLRQTYVFDERYLDELNKKISQKTETDILKHETESTDQLYSMTEFQYIENLEVSQFNAVDKEEKQDKDSTNLEQDNLTINCQHLDLISTTVSLENDGPEHKEQIFTCLYCDSSLESVKSCIMHWDQHFSEPGLSKLQCLLCSHVTYSKLDLENHFKTHFKLKTNSREKAKARQQKLLKNKIKVCSKVSCCRKCKETLDSIDVAVEHCLKHKPANVKFYPCIICFNGIGKTKLREHLSIHYPVVTKPILSCENCNNLYPDEKTLKYHRCTELRKYKCSQCNQGFKSEDRLKFHEDFHKNKSTFCDICKKDFKFESRIYLHFAGVHNGIRDKPYCCDVCGKTFTWLTLLNSHKRTHTNERPYKCSKCDARFCNKYSLNGHMPSHDDHPQMHCDKCDYHTGRKQNLQNHISRFHKEIHSTQMCIRCEICREVFPNEHHAHVEGHSHSKTNEAPKPFRELTVSKLYQCERCERCYASVEELTQHRSIHESCDSNSFYQCRLCDVSFSKHDLLVKHRKVHIRVTSQYTGKLSVLTVISCDICGMECVDYRQLLNHKDRANCMMKKITGTLRPRKVLIKKHLQPLKTHQLFVNSNGLFECPSCQRTYKNRRRYRLHLATHPNTDSFK